MQGNEYRACHRFGNHSEYADDAPAITATPELGNVMVGTALWRRRFVAKIP
jgi:hypothetical protein